MGTLEVILCLLVYRPILRQVIQQGLSRMVMVTHSNMEIMFQINTMVWIDKYMHILLLQLHLWLANVKNVFSQDFRSIYKGLFIIVFYIVCYRTRQLFKKWEMQKWLQCSSYYSVIFLLSKLDIPKTIFWVFFLFVLGHAGSVFTQLNVSDLEYNKWRWCIAVW